MFGQDFQLNDFKIRLQNIFVPPISNPMQGLENPAYGSILTDSIMSEANELDDLATAALRLFIEMGLISPPSPTMGESAPLLPTPSRAPFRPVASEPCRSEDAAPAASVKASLVSRVLKLLSEPKGEVLICPVRCVDGVTRNLHKIYNDREHSRWEANYHLDSFVFSAAATALLSAIWDNIDRLISMVESSVERGLLQTKLHGLREARGTAFAQYYQDANLNTYLTALKINYPSQIAYDSSRNYNRYINCAGSGGLFCLTAGLGLLLSKLCIPGAVFTALGSASYMYAATESVCYANKRMTCLEAWCLAKPVDISQVVEDIKRNLLVRDVIVDGQPSASEF